MAGLARRPVLGAAPGQHELVDALVGGEPGHDGDGDDRRMNGGTEVAHLRISSAWGAHVWSPACSMPMSDRDFTVRPRNRPPGGDTALVGRTRISPQGGSKWHRRVRPPRALTSRSSLLRNR